MKKIADLLSKFKKIEAPDQLIEKEAKNIILTEIGIEPSEEDLDGFLNTSFKKPNLTIKSHSSVLKNEIFFKKEKIKEKLKKKFDYIKSFNVFFK